jgi:hypothetical protein
MEFLSHKKMKGLVATLASTLLVAGSFTEVQAVSSPEKLTNYLAEFPSLGLILNEVSYGPITISDIHLNDGVRMIYAMPGQIIDGDLTYKIDTSQQEFLSRHHLVVGIKGLGGQDCAIHSLGIFNTKEGKADFTLKAPLEPGLYEVRFSYQEAPTCEEARSVWTAEMGEPSSATTIAIIIVE